MFDAHTHLEGASEKCWLCAAKEEEWGEVAARESKNVRVFFGVHPWYAKGGVGERLEEILREHPNAGVGEIGLDRLREKTVSSIQRECFIEQLEVASAMRRVVQLHGAKCWGEVVMLSKRYRDKIPGFVFHGFSRSEGLLGEIFAMNGYVSVGAAVLNDHAVNYREMVRHLPEERILLETDGSGADLAEICRKAAALRNTDADAFAARIGENARRLMHDA